MKVLLCVTALMFAVSLSAAEQGAARFAGRWAAIGGFGSSNNRNYTHYRALLTFEVGADGSITNGAVRDFAGQPLAGFVGQVDAKGRLNCSTMPVSGSSTGNLKLRLERTSGVGSFYTRLNEVTTFRSAIQCWRETKATPEAYSNDPRLSSVQVGLVAIDSFVYDQTIRPSTNISPIIVPAPAP